MNEEENVHDLISTELVNEIGADLTELHRKYEDKLCGCGFSASLICLSVDHLLKNSLNELGTVSSILEMINGIIKQHIQSACSPEHNNE